MSSNDSKLFRPVAGFSILLLIAVGLLISVCLPSAAQQPLIGQFGTPHERDSGVFLPSNRTDTRGVERSRKLIAEGEFSQAIRFLDEILARDEDSFVEGTEKVGASKEFFGLKTSVRQILKELPPEGRRIYETTFGPTARRLLRQVTTGDTQQLRQIAQRYFYTPAGHEAALMFAQFESDQGRHLSAALTYQQLLETDQAAARFQPQLSVLAAASWIASGYPTQAADALALLEKSNFRAVELAGQSFPVRGAQGNGAQDEKVDWFLQTVGTPAAPDHVAEQQWLMPRGNPARNGQTDGGLPHLRVRWQSRLLEHGNLETVFDELSSQMSRQKKPQLPAATLLAVDDYVITRSAHGLMAFDFNTGKRVWRAQPQSVDLLQSLIDSAGAAADNDNGLDPSMKFTQRIWEDYLYNTTSSDGQRVYVIRDIKSSLPRNRYSRLRGQLGNVRGMATNRLCAYDLATQGKLIWEVDGASDHDLLKGAFFLGAPVAVGQSLYSLVEIESETAIYLVALNRMDGSLQWRQQLANLEVGVGLSYERRLQASMPSYDEGILICPTGAGVVVAVDLAKQALAWAYRYPTSQRLSAQQQWQQAQTNKSNKHWVHSQPVITTGRVLLTPPDSKVLYCLDLVTGKLLWKQSRKESLFLAGVESQKVLLVGKRGITALNLANGEPVWGTEEFKFPVDAQPSGSGFFSQGRYYLPLSNAQVIGVDVATGELAVQTKSRDGQTLGNLICYRGAVLSQSGRSLDCFEQVDVLRSGSERRLAANPTDFKALRTLGEIAFNEGRFDQSIDLLVRANASEPNDLRTREVLSEALVAALDEEFAKYQDHLPLLAKILSGTGQSTFTLMRLQVKGLQQMGQADEAFAVCLKAYADLNVHEANLTIGRVRQVSVQRWISAQVAASWALANSDQRETMLEGFKPLLEENKKLSNLSLSQQFYDCFGALELMDTMGLELATEYQALGELLAAQQIFLKLVKSENLQVRYAAIAACSRLLHQAELPLLASNFDRQLRSTLADEECLSGQTGLQCLKEWGQADKQAWPYGQVESKVQKKIATGIPRNANKPHTGISLVQSDDILGSCNATLVGQASSGSAQSRVVTLRDSLGREFCRIKLDKSRRNRLNLRGAIFGVTRGNLMVLSLGHQIVAFDTFSTEARVLWSKRTTSNLPYNSLRIAQWKKLGRPPQVRSQANGQWLGLLGPVTRDSCLLQIDHRLVCVDSLTGETKWSRDDLPPGCVLFGDEEVVLAVPRNGQPTLVFSTVDGQSLGETALNLPTFAERLTTVGRQVIRWRRLPNKRWELSALDPWQGEVLWNYEFAKKTEIDLAQNRFAVVADSRGHCTIVDLNDGRKIVDQPIKTNPVLDGVYLLAGTDSFVVAVQQPMLVGDKRIRGFNRADFSEKSFSGQVYRFDRHSGLAVWDEPAEVQGLPLMLAQPVDLPMIAFAGNVSLHDRRGPARKTGIMLLEKSSGRMLFHREDLPVSSNYCFLRASESTANQAIVELSSSEIQINFTDRPRAPEPPMRFQAQRQTGSRERGLQKIGEKIYEKSGWPAVGR